MARSKSNHFALFLLVLSSTLSGINSPVIRYGLHSIPLPLFGFMRLLIPFLLLTPILYFTKHKQLKKKYIALAMFQGFLIYFCSNGLFYLGVRASGSVNAAAIGLLEPLLMFTFSVEVMRERLSPRILAGIIIAFIGSSLVVFGPLMLHGQLTFKGSTTGNLFLVGANLCSVCGVWVAKRLMKHVDQLQLLYWGLLPGALLYGGLSTGSWSKIPHILSNPNLLRVVLYGAILVGVVGYLCAFYALKRIKGQEYGIFEYIYPAVAALVAVIFFGEQFTPLLLVGVAVIFGGLYLAEVHLHKTLRSHLHFLKSR